MNACQTSVICARFHENGPAIRSRHCETGYPTGRTLRWARLSELVTALQWREMLEGWFTYALAGVAGLVFTKWGALAILQPHERQEILGRSIKLCVVIFLIAALGWYVWTH